MNKKSKIVTGVAVGLATLVGVGAVGLVSKGFRNWDVRDWVDGYQNVLEVSDESQLLCATCGTEAEFSQEGRAEIKFKSLVEGEIAHATAKLYDQKGKELKRANVVISANISLNEDTMAGITFGHDITTSGPKYYGQAFMLHYDSSSKLLRVVAYRDYVTYTDNDQDQHILPSNSSIYSNSYSLSYYGLSDLSNIKFSVSKVVTATGSSYEVKVGNKTVDFLTCCDDNGNYILVDGNDGDNASYTESKEAYPVYLTAYGTEATFRDVKWSE